MRQTHSASAYRDSNGVERMIVVEPPSFDDLARFRQTPEQVFVQAFITQPAIKTLRKAIYIWNISCPANMLALISDA